MVILVINMQLVTAQMGGLAWAPVQTGEAADAARAPGGAAVAEHDVFHRADARAGPAAVAVLIGTVVEALLPFPEEHADEPEESGQHLPGAIAEEAQD